MQDTSWADGLELIGDDQRLVAHVGAVPLRLLAERTGLTAGVSAAMRRRGFDPVYDRGQVLVDLALVLILGGEAISDFQSLAHLAPVIGPVPSTPTVWRALAETGELQVARLNAAVTKFRRYWPGNRSTARSSRAMLSAASLAVALPGRGSIASRSSVLSQLARFGQNPMPPL